MFARRLQRSERPNKRIYPVTCIINQLLLNIAYLVFLSCDVRHVDYVEGTVHVIVTGTIQSAILSNGPKGCGEILEWKQGSSAVIGMRRDEGLMGHNVAAATINTISTAAMSVERLRGKLRQVGEEL